MYHLALIIDDDYQCALTSLWDIYLNEGVNLYHMNTIKSLILKYVIIGFWIRPYEYNKIHDF